MKKAILLLCAMVTLSGCSGNPTDAYKAYIENIQKGDNNAVLDTMDKETKDLLSKEGGFSAAKEIKQFIDDHKGVKKIEFKDVTKKGGSATAKVSIFYNDGFSKEGIESKYVKENGTWKLTFAK